MKLKILLPSEVFLETTASKIIAEAENGYFCLEPRHVDFVAALAAGVLTYVDAQRQTWYVAIDEGILVKCGLQVQISTYKAVRGEQLETLKQQVETEILQLDEVERTTRSVLARLEAGILRRYGEFREVLK